MNRAVVEATMTIKNEIEQELIEDIQRGLAHFDQYDVDGYSDEVLIIFARKKNDIIKYLPKDRMSYDVLRAVVENDQRMHAFEYITSRDTDSYRELALLAVEKSWTSLKFIEREFVDSDFFKQSIQVKPKAIYTFLLHYPALVEALLSSQDLEAMLDIDRFSRNAIVGSVIRGKTETSLINDDYIKQTLLTCPNLLSDTTKSDRKSLAMELLDEGGWPADYSGLKPSGLNEAIKQLKTLTKGTQADWNRAYIMSFGIDQVVKAMRSPSKLPLLETIYTREEILPHLTQRRDLQAKGRWLEDDLGM